MRGDAVAGGATAWVQRRGGGGSVAASRPWCGPCRALCCCPQVAPHKAPGAPTERWPRREPGGAARGQRVAGAGQQGLRGRCGRKGLQRGREPVWSALAARKQHGHGRGAGQGGGEFGNTTGVASRQADNQAGRQVGRQARRHCCQQAGTPGHARGRGAVFNWVAAKAACKAVMRQGGRLRQEQACTLLRTVQHGVVLRRAGRAAGSCPLCIPG